MMCRSKLSSASSVASLLILIGCLGVLSIACGQAAKSHGSSHPKLSIETPASSASLLLPFRISGWSIDLGASSGTGVERVEILDGGCTGAIVGNAEYGLPRPDVAQLYGDAFKNSGWQLLITRLGTGAHVLGVRMHSALTGEGPCETVSVSVL